MDEKQTSSNNALIGAVLSFFLPGLGLLLGKEQSYIIKGAAIFVISIFFDAIVAVVGWLVCCCVFPGILLPSIASAVYTYDELAKKEGGKPIIFK